jgi:hypothetical protein
LLRRNGQITHADFDLHETYEHWFYNALLMETSFPTLDGSAKESGYVKVKFQPETMTLVKSPAFGPALKGRMGGADGKGTRQKLWTTSAFRLVIDGIDDMKYTNKIEGFTIKQGVKKVPTGDDRFAQFEPGKLEFPNLTGTISLAYAEKIFAWHKEYVVKGGKDHGTQKTGAIEFLSPDRSKVIFRLNLSGIGISYAGIVPATANQDAIKRVKFELFVHAMDLDGSGGLGFE